MAIPAKDDLVALEPRFEFFVGIDSDGCVFDTMTAKQCRHFHPMIIQHWGLEAVAAQVREVAEFINLRSIYRGRNRFPALLMTFEMLAGRPGVAESGVALPPVDDLRAYCNSGLPLGNASLAAEVERTGSAELAKVLEWSVAVNEDIARNMDPAPPFAHAVESLELINRHADAMVVSQTPVEALMREWRHFGIMHLARVIAGQELGSKAEQLRLAAGGKYGEGKVILIGDAPGDLVAAREAGVAFYPIVPGDEVQSWKLFHDEIFAKFLAGEYAGEYAGRIVRKFESSLPDTLP